MTARPHAPHFRFWPKGVARELRVPQASLPDYLDTAAQRYPDKPAIVYCGRSISYIELKQDVDALAQFLVAEAKLQPGERVLIASQNCPQFVIAFYAVLRAGGVVVPVNPMSKAAEVRYYAQDSGARIAFVAHDLLENVPQGLFDKVIVHAYSEAIGEEAGLPAWVTAPLTALRADCVAWAATAGTRARPTSGADPVGGARVPTEPTALAVLPYTSGTTGHPKGCMHTHATVIASLASSQVWKGLHAESVFLAVAPLFHMLGMQNGMNMPIFTGGTAIMLPRWDAAAAARLIEQHRVSVWTAPPAMVIDLFAHPDSAGRDLSSLTLLSGGGAAMPEAVSAMLAERYGLAYNEAYGLSETAAFLHGNPLARGKRQCLGVPTQGVDSRIVDPATLSELPPGEVGELVTHGPQVMLGYWKQPEADRESFVEIDGKRFFRTGDLATMDDEGYFFMRDRLKRMINASGYKVWPAEVESAMYEHPAIHEACVVAVPDARRGESVKALVVLKPASRGTVTEQQIIEWARERMAVYKAPRTVQFMDTLPKSGTGKILWRELQEQQRAQPQEQAA